MVLLLCELSFLQAILYLVDFVGRLFFERFEMSFVISTRLLYELMGVCLEASQFIVLVPQARFQFLAGQRLLLSALFQLVAGMLQLGFLLVERGDLRAKARKLSVRVLGS